MIVAVVSDVHEWRTAARHFLATSVSPQKIVWQDKGASQSNLFDEQPVEPRGVLKLRIPKEFVPLMQRVSCHRLLERWSRLYEAIWMIAHGENHLMGCITDPVMHRLFRMDGEVRRDAHKTKAFVRFKQCKDGNQERYIAWHNPDHRILSLVAPFFQRRFTHMQWSILTPDESVEWDEKTLRYGAGVPEQQEREDATEELWLTYYKSTFNPARVNVDLMKREMPVRHWKTLPEAVLIPSLLSEAPKRVERMISQNEGFKESASTFIPEIQDYTNLKKAAQTCRGCPLHCNATQVVFGEGNLSADIMLLGEQPGDIEDQFGKPFIGPAGSILEAILERLKMSRENLYVTNAVKHFKFVQQGKKRIHQSPSAREVNACKPWVLAEINTVRPRVIVSLGLTAARSILHHGFSLKHDGARDHFFKNIPVVPTWHPSAVLRTADKRTKADITEHIDQSLQKAARIVADASIPGMK